MTSPQDRIRAYLPDHYQHVSIEHFDSIESTNSHLLQQKNVSNRVCLAEHQTRGRGRRGRQWQSVSQGSILMSLGWELEGQEASGLSLVIGLAVADVLLDYGVQGVGLKWPNDLLVQEKKICGILVEMNGKRCVIGIGLNVNFPDKSELQVDQPWIDLNKLGVKVDKEELTANLIARCFGYLKVFCVEKFSYFRSNWNALHVFQDRLVNVTMPDEAWIGVARGVDEAGALMIEKNGTMRKIMSGEATIRLHSSRLPSSV